MTRKNKKKTQSRRYLKKQTTDLLVRGKSLYAETTFLEGANKREGTDLWTCRAACDVCVFDDKYTELGKKNEIPPSEVFVVVKLDRVWTSSEEVVSSICAHVTAGDLPGASRGLAQMEEHGHFDQPQRRRICGLALIDYISSSDRHTAARREETVRFLLGLDCDVNAFREEGESALYASIKHRRHSIARLLLSETEIDIDFATMPWNVTPLLLAVAQEDVEGVRLLLEFKADVNQEDAERHTPLSSIGISSFPKPESEFIVEEIRQMLLAAGATPGGRDWKHVGR